MLKRESSMTRRSSNVRGIELCSNQATSQTRRHTDAATNAGTERHRDRQTNMQRQTEGPYVMRYKRMDMVKKRGTNRYRKSGRKKWTIYERMKDGRKE